MKGTASDIKTYLQASPSLVVLAPYPKELAHEIVQRWVIPTEILPSVHLGNLKGRGVRASLLLGNNAGTNADGIAIERLAIAETALLDEVYKFLEDTSTVTVGTCTREFDPRVMRKTVGEVKRTGEAELEKCCGVGWSQDRT